MWRGEIGVVVADEEAGFSIFSGAAEMVVVEVVSCLIGGDLMRNGSLKYTILEMTEWASLFDNLR